MATINGVVLSKENIAFLKKAQEEKRMKNHERQRREAEKRYLASIDEKMPRPKKAKTKLSHAARKARIVARSIATDPKNKVRCK